MGHQKTISKLQSGSNNVTFDEVTLLLKSLGYKQLNKGKTSGSRVKFINFTGEPIYLHNPHPRKTLLPYQVKQIINELKGKI
ncbi:MULTISPECIES: type II toxin-antitoxin system HicA family toxin [Lactobacillaceae]|uniref:type II toxin-antitoxin system HicA family toxin n=1 Tax=Lactobacillaceae TaxID=33958 RepID=UPI001F595765|nr:MULTISPECIES: type II toxin-antitoxin system HicA family toxin [Lactobacillaceae]